MFRIVALPMLSVEDTYCVYLFILQEKCRPRKCNAYLPTHLPEILHELRKDLRPSRKWNNDIYCWPGDVHRFTLHFHQGPKWAKQCDMSVVRIICLLVEQLILCPFVSLRAIITLRTTQRRSQFSRKFHTLWQTTIHWEACGKIHSTSAL